jgi:hypothetical protein
MSNRIGVAAICLHISSITYVIVGLALLGYFLWPQPTGMPPEAGVACCIFCLLFASGIEVVARALLRRKYWAWVAGMCIFTFYIPTVFLPLGTVGLWALLAPATRALVGVGPLTSVSRRPGSSSIANVVFRLLLLTIVLTAVAVGYVRVSGAGMPPYPPVPEPSEIERIHRLVGLALFAIAGLSVASLALLFVAMIMFRYRRRSS